MILLLNFRLMEIYLQGLVKMNAQMYMCRTSMKSSGLDHAITLCAIVHALWSGVVVRRCMLIHCHPKVLFSYPTLRQKIAYSIAPEAAFQFWICCLHLNPFQFFLSRCHGFSASLRKGTTLSALYNIIFRKRVINLKVYCQWIQWTITLLAV